MIKLRNRVISLFMIFALAIILLINIVSHILIKGTFNNYIKDKIEERKSSIIHEVTSSYSYGEWDINKLEKAGLAALENGLIIRVSNNYDEIIWDANEEYNSMCKNMLHEMNSNMNKINNNNQEEYIEESYNINYENKNIGVVSIGYSGPIYYNNSDIMFFETLHVVLIIVSIVAMILSIVVGIILSFNISKPILNMVNSTKEIANGNYKKKLKYEDNIKELKEMIDSINELSDSLQKDEYMRKMLTRDISHELRTPLTTIELQIEALIDNVWEPTVERLVGIQNEIYRLTRLVKSLEELSQYDSDMLVLDKENTDLKEMIEKLIINFEKQAIDKNIEITKNIEHVNINIDIDKVSQCIINLISNSIKYTEDGGNIEVRCYKDNTYAYIAVKDNGIGMEIEHLKNIFERFYRIDASRSRKTGGVGVGLTISKAIVEAHGGNIIVNSKINEGSEFTILLPLN